MLIQCVFVVFVYENTVAVCTPHRRYRAVYTLVIINHQFNTDLRTHTQTKIVINLTVGPSAGAGVDSRPTDTAYTQTMLAVSPTVDETRVLSPRRCRPNCLVGACVAAMTQPRMCRLLLCSGRCRAQHLRAILIGKHINDTHRQRRISQLYLQLCACRWRRASGSFTCDFRQSIKCPHMCRGRRRQERRQHARQHKRVRNARGDVYTLIYERLAHIAHMHMRALHTIHDRSSLEAGAQQLYTSVVVVLVVNCSLSQA